MPVAAFRLTGSASGFHDSALVSMMVHVAPDAPRAVHRTAARLPSMARERLCWAPWTGPRNGRRVSRVMSYLCTSPTRSAAPDDAQTLRCQAPLRADRPRHAHTQPGAGSPGRPRSGRASGIAKPLPAPDVLSRSGSYMPPVAPGRRHGWRSPGIGRDTAPAAGRPRTQGAALLTGWPRSRETAPLGVRRMQMMRHDDAPGWRQRSDWLGVRRASSAESQSRAWQGARGQNRR